MVSGIFKCIHALFEVELLSGFRFSNQLTGKTKTLVTDTSLDYLLNFNSQFVSRFGAERECAVHRACSSHRIYIVSDLFTAKNDRNTAESMSRKWRKQKQTWFQNNISKEGDVIFGSKNIRFFDWQCLIEITPKDAQFTFMCKQTTLTFESPSPVFWYFFA